MSKQKQTPYKMTLLQRIEKIIKDYSETVAPYMREAYEDCYDGFAHCSYSGLADDVISELNDLGYSENVPDSVIEEIVADYYN